MSNYDKDKNTNLDIINNYTICPIQCNFELFCNQVFNPDNPINEEIYEYKENEDQFTIKNNSFSFSSEKDLIQTLQNNERSKSAIIIKSNEEPIRLDSKCKSATTLKKIYI